MAANTIPGSTTGPDSTNNTTNTSSGTADALKQALAAVKELYASNPTADSTILAEQAAELVKALMQQFGLTAQQADQASTMVLTALNLGDSAPGAADFGAMEEKLSLLLTSFSVNRGTGDAGITGDSEGSRNLGRSVNRDTSETDNNSSTNNNSNASNNANNNTNNNSGSNSNTLTFDNNNGSLGGNNDAGDNNTPSALGEFNDTERPEITGLVTSEFDQNPTPTIQAPELTSLVNAGDLISTFSGTAPEFTVLTDVVLTTPSTSTFDTITTRPSFSGLSLGILLTRESNPTIHGTAEPLSAISLIINNQAVASAEADSNGAWSVTAPTLPDGDYSLMVTVIDPSGNKAESDPVTLTIDTVVATPTFDFFQSVTTGAITNAPPAAFTGKGDVGSTVELFIDGKSIGVTTIGADGVWSITTPSLTDAVYQIQAVTTDKAGNTSASPAIALAIDTVVAQPTFAFTDGLVIPTDKPTLSGSGEPGATVSVDIDDVAVGSTLVDSASKWSFPIVSALPRSINKIKLTIKDTAGNISSAGPFNIIVDKDAPAVGQPIDIAAESDTGSSDSDNISAATSVKISSNAEASSSVKIFNDADNDGVIDEGELLSTTTADSTGSWNVTLENLAEGTYQLRFIQTDGVGNSSAAATATALKIDRTVVAPSALLLASTSDTGISSTDRFTADNTPTLSGTGEAGAVLSLFNDIDNDGVIDAGELLATTTVDDSGNWSITTSTLTDGSYNLKTTQTDVAGNKSTASKATSIIIDTNVVTSLPPTLNAASDSGSSTGDRNTNVNKPILSGTAEVGATVTLFDDIDNDGVIDSGEILGTATARSNLKWSITASTLTDGIHNLKTQQTDMAGNISAASTATSVVIDTQAPTVGAALDVAADTDTGSSTGDNTTAAQSIKVSGIAEAGTVINIFNDIDSDGVMDTGELLGTATADADGGWTKTLDNLPEGGYNLRFTQTDTAGNTSTASPTTSLVIDRTVSGPSKPTLFSGSDTGTSNSDRVTADTTPTFSGTGEANSLLVLFNDLDDDGVVDATEVIGSTTVGSNGSWLLTTGTLAEGSYNVKASQTDVAGNLSIASSGTQITVDTSVSPPSQPTLPAASDSGSSTTDHITKVTQPILTGSAEVGATVTLFEDLDNDSVVDSGEILGTATANSAGAWSITASTLTVGTHTLQAVQQDVAGNNSGVSTSTTLIIDTSVAASNFSIQDDTGDSSSDYLSHDNALIFSGFAEPNATIELLLTDGSGTMSIGTSITGDGGEWSFDYTATTLADGDYSLVVKVTDVAGNTVNSVSKTFTIDSLQNEFIDLSPLSLAASTDSGTSDSDGVTSITLPTIEFTSLAENTLEVDWGDGNGFEFAGDGTGSLQQLSLTTAYTTDGEKTIQVRATDIVGNQSLQTLTFILDTANSAKITALGSDSGKSASDTITNIKQPILSGVTEAEATITLYDDIDNSGTLDSGEEIGSATVGVNGGFIVTATTVLSDGTHKLRVQSTDLAGNIANSAAQSVTIDSVINTPSVIDLASGSDTGTSSTDNNTKATLLSLSGSAEANSVVEIFSDTDSDGVFDSGERLATTATNGSGQWTTDLSELPQGTYNLRAIATDTAGNVSTAATVLSVVLDRTAPAISKPDLSASSDTGSSSSDDITSDATPTVTGTTEVGASVTVFIDSDNDGQIDNGEHSGTATVDGSGNWTYTPTSDLAADIHGFRAIATDAAGNVSKASSVLSVNIPIPVAAPSVTGITTDTGISSSDLLTNDTTLTINGSSAADKVIQLFLNGNSLGTTTSNSGGVWSFVHNTALTAGSYAFTATAKDVAGNTSVLSTALNVTIDTSTPTPTISAISDDTGSSSSDYITNDTLLIITGTAEAGSSVSVARNSLVLGTATANNSGQWSLTVGSAIAEGSHSLVATATDKAGNIASSATKTLIVDTSIQNNWTLDLTDASDLGLLSNDDYTADTTLTLSGTAEASSSIQLYADANLDGTLADSELLGTTTTDNAGKWSFTTNALAEGSHRIAGKITDIAGNIATGGTTLTVTIDSANPAAPTDLDLSAASDTGTSQTDNVTSATTLTVTGQGEAGLTVRLFTDIDNDGTFDSNELLGTATVNESGQWSVVTSTLTAGIHQLRAYQFDAAGNNSGSSSALAVTIDIAATASGAIALTTDTGSSSSDKITADNTPGFSGSGAEASATITLFDDVDNDGVIDLGETLGTTSADGSGNWSFTSRTLDDGVHRIKATQTDNAGNTSSATSALSVTIDTVVKAPSAPDLASASDSGSSSSDNITNKTTPSFSGTGEVGAVVTLFEDLNNDGIVDSDEIRGTATVDGSGNWTITSSNLSAGKHTLQAVQTDVAGNASTISDPLTLSVDTSVTASVTGIDNDTGASSSDLLTKDKTLLFFGTSEASATIQVKLNGNVIGSTTAGANGKWSYDHTATSLADGSYSLVVVATDLAGNTTTTTAKTVTVDANQNSQIDLTPISLLSSSDSGTSNSDLITNDTTPTIEFTSLADNTLEIDWGNGSGFQSLGAATGSAQQITFDAGYSSGGEKTIQVRATDLAGNISTQSLVVTIDTGANIKISSVGQDSGSSSSDLISNDTTATLKGTTDVNATLVLFDDANNNETLDSGETLASGSADSIGVYSLTSTVLAEGTHTLRVKTTDVAGNSSVSISKDWVVDTSTVAPSNLDLTAATDAGSSSTDNITNALTLTVAGNSEANSTVKVFNDLDNDGVIDSAELLTTATADSSGNWSADLDKPLEGSYTLKAIATDVAGNNSTASSALSVTVDRTVVATSTPDLITASDSGSSSSDNLTNAATPTFSGTGDIGATVTLFADINNDSVLDSGESLGTATVDNSGNWSVTSSALTDSTHIIRARQTDVAGNISKASAALAVTIDAAMATPSVTSISSDSGSSSTDLLTNDTTLTINGSSEASKTIQLFLNSSAIGSTTSNSSGVWSFVYTTALTAGSHSFTATATDTAGNTSAASSALVVTIDTSTATPTISAISDDTGSSSTDFISNDNALIITGTAEADSTVNVTKNSVSLGTATTNSSGQWSLTLASTLADGSHTLVATATDTAGNSASSVSKTVTIDTAIQNNWSIDLTDASDLGALNNDDYTADTTLTLSGTAEANSTVKIYADANLDSTLADSELLGTTTSNSSGVWSYTTAALAEGSHRLGGKITDIAGNTATGSSTLTVTLDTTTPAAPTALDLSAASDTGSSQADDLTSATQLTVTGLGEAGLTVRLFVDSDNDGSFDSNELLGSATVNNSGQWSVLTSTLGVGTHQLKAYQFDAAGNDSSASSALAVTIDTVATASSAITLTTDTGSSASDKITADNTPSFSGSGAEANALMTIFDDVDNDGVIDLGETLGTTSADGSGNWSFTSRTLDDGVHSIKATQTDIAGNTSSATSALSITVDTVAKPPSAPDLASASDSGSSSSDNITNKTTPTITGTGEIGATVTLFEDANNDSQADSSEIRGTATVDGSGNWSITSSALSAGKHTLQAVQTDIAGNASGISDPLTVSIDTSVTASVNGIDTDTGASSSDFLTKDKTLLFTGTADANATIQVKLNGNVLGSTTAGANGKWSYDHSATSLADGSYSLVVIATDVAGNTTTTTAKTITVDANQNSQIDLSAVILVSSSDSGTSSSDLITNDNTPTIEFTSLSDNTLEIDWGNGAGFQSLGAATGSAQQVTLANAYSTDGAKTIQVRATDLAGNISTQTLTITVDTGASVKISSVSQDSFNQNSGSSSSDLISNDTTPTLKGTTDANAIVELFEDINNNETLDSGELLASGTTDSIGVFNLTSPVLTEGTHTLRAKTSDIAGNIGVSVGKDWVVDTSTVAPTNLDLTAASDAGSSSTDNITNATSLTIEGNSEANSTVKVFNDLDNDGVIDSAELLTAATAGSDGKWSAVLDKPSEGSYNLKAIATDLAGNISATSSALSVTVDRTVAAPSTPDLTIAADSGSSSSDNLTKITVPTFSGTGEKGATVTLFEDLNSNSLLDSGESLGTATVDNAGAWSLTSSTLSDGAHTVRAVQTDIAGNTSKATANLSISIDSTLVTPTISLDSSSDTGASSSDKITKDTTPTISFSAEKDAAVEIDWNDGRGYQAAGVGTGAAKSYTQDKAYTSDGEKVIGVKVTDAAGNTVSSSLTVTLDTVSNGLSLAFDDDTGFTSIDGITTDNLPTFSGSAEIAAQIVLYNDKNNNSVLDSGETISDTITADAEGNWSYDSSEGFTDGSYKLRAYQVDLAGNTSSQQALTLQVDTRIDDNFTIDLATVSDLGFSTTDDYTADTTPTITGSSEVDAVITLYEDANGNQQVDSGEYLGSATVGSDGNWSITSSALGEGKHTLSAYVADVAGNTKNGNKTQAVTIDTTTPSAPGTPDLSSVSDSGSSSSDNLTNATTTTFTGTGEAGLTLNLFSDANNDGILDSGELLGTGNVNSSGKWSISATPSAGSHTVKAQQSDPSGNVSVASTGLSVTIDRSAASLSAPTLASGDDSGSSASDGITSTSTLHLSGSGAESGAGITLFNDIDSDGVIDQGETLSTATADNSGAWSLTTGTLSDASYKLKVVQTDVAGNTSSASSAKAVTVDSTAAAPSTPDLTAASDSGSSSIDNITKNTAPAIAGTGEVGATVTLFEDADSDNQADSGEILGTATVGSNGQWTITTGISTSSTLSEGKHTLQAVQTDVAGNASGASKPLTISIDGSTSGSISAIEDDTGSSSSDFITRDNGLTFVGLAEAGSTVQVRLNNNVIGTVTTDDGGKWKYTHSATLSDGTFSLTATVTDKAGNTLTTSAKTVVIDSLQNSAIDLSALDLIASSDTGTSSTDNITNDATPTIEFTSLTENTLTVDWGDGNGFVSAGAALGTAQQLTLGTAYSTDGEKTIKVKAVDIAGNESLQTIKITVDRTAAVTIKTVSDDTGSNTTDNITSDNTPTVAGTTENSASVILFDDKNSNGSLDSGESLASGSANTLGAFSLTGSTLADGAHSLRVQTTDTFGNVAVSSAKSWTVDATAVTPSALDLATASDSNITTDNITNATDLTISGTSEASNKIQLFVDKDNDGVIDSGELLATISASNSTDGSWSTVLKNPAEGSYTLKAIATDPSGNNSTASSALTVTVDRTKPAAAGTPDLATASDSGSSSSDNLTNVSTPTFTGSGETNATVTLFNDADNDGVIDSGESLGTATVSSGSWSITSSTLSSGSYTIKASQSDVAGNSGIPSASLSVTVDASATLGSLDLTEASDSGDLTAAQTLFFYTDYTNNSHVYAYRIEADTTTQVDISGTEQGSYANLVSGNNSYHMMEEGSSSGGGVSDDGRYVLFSASSFLSNSSTNAQLYRKDLQTGTVEKVSTSSSGSYANDYLDYGGGVLSNNGRYVAFATTASNLVSGDSNSLKDVFLKDVQTGTITRVSTKADSTQASSGSTYDYYASAGDVTNDGHYVLFTSSLKDLVSGDTNDGSDIFRKDTQSGAIVRVSLRSDGTQTSNTYGYGLQANDITEDGRYVLFSSSDNQMVSGLGSSTYTQQLYRKDITNNSLTLVSSTNSGTASDGSYDTTAQGLSEDGRYVLFTSSASNLGATGDYTGDLFLKDLQTGTLKLIGDVPAYSYTNNSSTWSTVSGVQFVYGSGDTPTQAVFMLKTTTYLWSNNTNSTNSSYTLYTYDISAGTASSKAVTMNNLNNDYFYSSGSQVVYVPGSGDASMLTDNVTKDTTPTIAFSAEKDAKVEINWGDGRGFQAVATASGETKSYTQDQAYSSDGAKTITVKVTDLMGNVNSATMTLTIDTVASAPTLLLTTDTGSSSTDNITYDNTPTMSGTAENNARIVLYRDINNNSTLDTGETISATITANSSGVWSHTLDTALSDGSHILRAYQVDRAGNTSSQVSRTVVIDATTPSAPTSLDLAAADDTGSSSADNITLNTTALTISGSGETGTTVTVFDDADSDGVVDSGESLGTATVTSGAFSVDVSLAVGTHSVKANQTDTAGNTSSASTVLAITIDTLAAAPTSLDLAAADDSGSSSTDNITKNTSSLTISGGGETGATVTVFDDLDSDGVVDSGESLGAATVSSSAFSLDVSLAAGTHSVKAVQTDIAGVNSAVSSALSITVDTTAAAPTALDLATADDTGSSSSDNITSNTTALTISGAGETGATVTVFDDIDSDGVVDSGESLGTATVSSSAFSLDVALSSGTHSVKAVQTDIAGNASTASSALSITVDTTAAAPTGLDLATADDTGSSTTDNITQNTTSLTISGAGETGATVTVFDDADSDGVVDSGESLGTATVSSSAFSLDVALSSGTHSVKAVQTDIAGNASSASSVLSITVDTTAAAPTSLDLATADDTGSSTSDNITSGTSALTISGAGETGATVTIFNDADGDGVVDSGESLNTATVSSGAFSADIALSTGSTYSVKAIQTDLAGNTSSASTALSITIDASTPSAPTGLDLATADDTGSSSTDNITSNTTALTISGAGETGTTVTIFNDADSDGVIDSGETLTTATVSSSAFSADIALTAGSTYSIKAIQTDTAGNASSASSALSITVDSSASAPTSLDLAAADDTGSSTSDNITSSTSALTISGSGETGANVTIFNDADSDGVVDSGESLNTATVSGGAFSADIALSTGSTYSVKAIQTDLAGNTSSASSALSITIDASTPSAPTGLDLAAADDTGSSSTDNITSNTTALTISGAGETGTTVTIFNDADSDGVIDSGEILTTATVSSSAFSADIALTAGSTYSIKAIQTDTAGNASSASSALSITVDTSASAPTSLDLATADDTGSSTSDNITSGTTALTISGAGETGATVTIFNDADSDGVVDSGESLNTATVSSGAFSADIALSTGSTYSIKAIQTDLAGNTSSASSALSITIDASSPSAPTGLDLAAADDSGSSSTDNTTSNTTALTISGVGETGTTVTIFNDADSDGVIDSGETLTTATVSSSAFSADIALTAGSTYSIKAIQTDTAGNASSASSALSITVDTSASAPTSLDLATADDTGSSTSDNITSGTSALTISGSGETGATVTIFNDADSDGVVDSGESLNTATVSSGAFSADIALSTGSTYSIKAIQTDLAGNTSSVSSALSITVDASTPSAPTSLDLAAADDSGSSNTDNITANTTALTISGAGESGTTVTIFNDADSDGVIDSGETLTTATVSSSAFSADIALTAGSTYSIKAIQTDTAGNASSASSALSITVDSSASAPSSLDLATADDTGSSTSDNITSGTSALTISGAGETGATVTIFNDADSDGVVDSGESLNTATVSSGAFSADIALSTGSTYSVKAIQTDLAGNTSSASSALSITIDASTPSAPTSLDLTAADDSGSSSTDNITSSITALTISGAGETGTTVTIFNDADSDGVIDSGETLTTATVSSSAFSADIALTAGSTYSIKAIQTDTAGNASSASSALSITVDTSASAPSSLDLATADDTGSSTSDNITSNTSALTISGVAETGATITIFNDADSDGVVDSGESLNTATGSGGAFSADISLTAGSTYSVKAIQTDLAGNISSASSALSITVDTSASAPTSLDLAAADDTGASSTDNLTKNTSALTISGAGETGATVTIFDDADSDGVVDSGESLGTGTVSSSAFSVDVSLAAGTHSVKAVQTDLAGNASTASSALSIVVDTTIPTGTITSARYDDSGNTIAITGTNLTTLLESSETSSTDITSRLDWTKFVWDINSDGSTTADVTFTSSDISSTVVGSATSMTISLSSSKASSLEGTTAYATGSSNSDDALDVTAGFLRDTAANAATTDGVANGAISLAVNGGSGNDTLYGTANADDLYANNGADTIIGGNGIDNVFVGSTSADIIDLQGITSEANRDNIFTFSSSSGDQIRIAGADTSSTSGTVLGTDTTTAGSGGGAYTLTGVTANQVDVVVLQNGANLPTASAGGGDLGTDGTGLLAALTSTGTSGDSYVGFDIGTSIKVYLLAYRDNNGSSRHAELYYGYDASNGGILAANEIHLVAHLDWLGSGETLSASNFSVV